jgi:ADP-heptose:LPS heptosyltransferase
LDGLSPGAHVAVVRLRSLGDCVLTTPALRVLKAARPDLQIGVVVDERFRAVFTGNPDVAAILTPSVRAIRAWRPALTINFHGGTRSAILTAASGARRRAAFAHSRFQPLYNVRVPTAQQILGIARKVHTAEHLASAMFALGVPQCEIPRARLFAPTPVRRARPYAVIHPFASAPDKTWPAANFVSIAKRLDAEFGLEPVFIAAAGDSCEAFAQFEVVAGADLEEIKNLLAGASLFIGNDSGPAHMAAAFGLRTIVLFGASDETVWGPWRTDAEVFKSADIAAIAPAAVLSRVGAVAQ